MEHNPLLRILYVGAGPLIWAANFVLMHAFTAAACARGFATTTIAGVGGVVWAMVVSTFVAILAAAWIAYKALSRYRARCAQMGSPDTECYIHFTAAAVAVLSLVGMGWTAFAAAVSFSCR